MQGAAPVCSRYCLELTSVAFQEDALDTQKDGLCMVGFAYRTGLNNSQLFITFQQ